MKSTKAFFKIAFLSMVFFLTAFNSKADFVFNWANNVPGCSYTVKIYDNFGTLLTTTSTPGIVCCSGTFGYVEIISCNIYTYDCTTGFISSVLNTGTKPICCPNCCAIDTTPTGTRCTCVPFSGPPCLTATTSVNLSIQ